MQIGECAGELEEPCTVVGRWMLAVLLHQRESELRLGRMLNGGKSGWNKDEPAVIEIACEFAVRRYFKSSINIDEIAAFVADMRGRVRSTSPPGQSETEALIRLALGDRDIAVPQVSASEIFLIHGTVVGQVVYRLQLTQAETRRLVERAERQAFKRGWNPPLYS
jgi:hypothetical protein